MKKHILICLSFLCVVTQAMVASADSVKVEKSSESQWRLFVEGQPYFIKGVEYRVSRIGQSPDKGTLRDWATYDVDDNGINDVAYESFIDKNNNDVQDADEPNVGDFQLLKDMGANTIRWYANGFPDQKPDKELFRDLYSNYGIRVAVGNFFGAYTIDTGASWQRGTDYIDFAQRQKILESVRKTVLEHKDEPYVLMWILGNENNLRFTNTNAERYPEAYASLLGEATRMIKKLDGKHPVAICNGDVGLLRYYAVHCQDVDILGVNVYRGADGFGNLFKAVKRNYDKPLLITEYGGAEASGYDQEHQAYYHENAWKDIRANAAGASGVGNCIGGIAFEWVDEWWKAGDPFHQAKKDTNGKQGIHQSSWTQEYCGLMEMGSSESQGHRLRRPRKAYYLYKKLWNSSKK